MPFQQVPWCVCGCLCMLAARSQQQANDIYESGIKYLRAHKTSARIAHRHDFLKLCSIPAALVSIECARVRGMDFFFGIAFRRCTTLCCKKWCAYTPNTQQFPSSTLRLSTTNWRTAFATVPRLIFKAVAQPLQYLKQFQHMTCAHGNSGLNWRHWHNFLEEDQMKWAKCTLGSHCVFCLHPCARCHVCDVYDTWNLVRMRHMPTCISKKPIEISPPCITLQAHRWSWSAWLPKFHWHIIWCALSCVAGYLRWKGTSGVWTNSQWKNWKKKWVGPAWKGNVGTSCSVVCCWSWDGGWFGDGGWWGMGIVYYSYHLCCLLHAIYIVYHHEYWHLWEPRFLRSFSQTRSLYDRPRLTGSLDLLGIVIYTCAMYLLPIYIYICMSVCMYVCMHACMYVCMRVL